MGRIKRTWVPDAFYHIVSRGNRRDPLFQDQRDFQVFLHTLSQTHEKTPFELASYCFMTNHYHLQLRSQEEHISKVMALVNKRYANYYNARYRLCGHVFEKRYYSKIIDGPQGMLAVSRYIHLNPLEAKMVKTPEHYPWSSFRYFTNQKKVPPFLCKELILDCFDGSLMEKQRKYCDYVKAEEQEEIPEVII